MSTISSITSIPGIRVGHWTNLEAATGCTVVLCEQGAVAGVDVRGGAPATRETDLLRPGGLVGRAHAILHDDLGVYRLLSSLVHQNCPPFVFVFFQAPRAWPCGSSATVAW